MNTIDKILDYNQRENSFKQEALDMKKEFENYITDKSIPILERWNVFINSSDNLKNNLSAMVKFNHVRLQAMIENSMHSNRRGMQHTMKKIMSNFVEDDEIQGYRFCDPDFEYDEDELTEEDFQKFNQELEQALEEILSKNIASFVYDW